MTFLIYLGFRHLFRLILFIMIHKMAGQCQRMPNKCREKYKSRLMLACFDVHVTWQRCSPFPTAKHCEAFSQTGKALISSAFLRQCNQNPRKLYKACKSNHKHSNMANPVNNVANMANPVINVANMANMLIYCIDTLSHWKLIGVRIFAIRTSATPYFVSFATSFLCLLPRHI